MLFFSCHLKFSEPTPHSQNQTPLPPQPNHPTNNCKDFHNISTNVIINNDSYINQYQFDRIISIAASNIPSHNVQSHIYPQSQPQFMQNYLPHMGPAGNFYHLTPYIPSVHFSHFTANVNVHGYTQAMQPPSFLPANYIPDNHQSGVEQVRLS